MYSIGKASWMRLLKGIVASAGGWLSAEGLLNLAPILDVAPDWIPVAILTGALMAGAKFLRNKYPVWCGWLKFM